MPRHRRRDLTDPEVIERELPAWARARVEAISRGHVHAPLPQELEEPYAEFPDARPLPPHREPDARPVRGTEATTEGTESSGWVPSGTWPPEPRPAPFPEGDDAGAMAPGVGGAESRMGSASRGIRWRTTPLAAAGLAAVAMVAVVVVLVLWRLSAPHAVPVPARGAAVTSGNTAGSEAPTAAPSGPRPASVSGPSASTSASAVALVVDVAGAVRHPGVVELPAGARVQDGLRAAGGALPGAQLQLLNLARRLQDGEQVVVPAAGETAPPAAAGTGGASGGGAAGGGTPGGPAAGAAGGAVLDLNAATVSDLDQLPGVGPVLAQRIIDWREQHGRFTTVDELREVSGIGDARFQDLSKRVRV